MKFLRTLGVLLALLPSLAWGQSVTLLPNGMQQFVDENGAPYAGGKVNFYIPNTLTPKTTWSNSAGTVANSNPVVLDSSGRAVIWGRGSYRQVLTDAFGNTIWDQATQGNQIQQTTIVSTAQSVGAANNLAYYVNTTAVTYTIAASSTLGAQWAVTIFAEGGVATVNVNAGDAINGGVVGQGTTIPQGASATLTTDGNGHIYLALTNPTVLSVNYSLASGFVNKFRNGTMDIWQRGVSALPTATTSRGVYTADGWRVLQNGAAGNCSQGNGTGGVLYSLVCTGATGNTDTLILQPIESSVAAPLAGQVVTVQFEYIQTSGASVAPKVSTCYAVSLDTFSSCTTDLASTAVTSCNSNNWCLESYTFLASASAKNGYQVTIDCNVALTAAQYCAITQADIRATPGVALGVNASPPTPELRPIEIELAFCQRYFYMLQSGIIAQSYAGVAGQGIYVQFIFPVTMRTYPAITNSWNACVNASGVSYTNVGLNMAQPYITAAAAGVAYCTYLSGNYATAEL